MTNAQRNRLIVCVNEALMGRLPARVRSISADLDEAGVALQVIHDGEIGEAELALLADLDMRVGTAMGAAVRRELIRVDAPLAYAGRLLPLVILAMFEQTETA